MDELNLYDENFDKIMEDREKKIKEYDSILNEFDSHQRFRREVKVVYMTH